MSPNAVRKPVITAIEINEYLALQESIAALKRRMETLGKLADQAEDSIVAKLDFGANGAAAGFLLSVRQTEKRFPAWKEHFIEACGKAKADRVLEATDAKVYRDLIVKKAA